MQISIRNILPFFSAFQVPVEENQVDSVSAIVLSGISLPKKDITLTEQSESYNNIKNLYFCYCKIQICLSIYMCSLSGNSGRLLTK